LLDGAYPLKAPPLAVLNSNLSVISCSRSIHFSSFKRDEFNRFPGLSNPFFFHHANLAFHTLLKRIFDENRAKIVFANKKGSILKPTQEGVQRINEAWRSVQLFQ
jgi:hypothetical protein